MEHAVDRAVSRSALRDGAAPAGSAQPTVRADFPRSELADSPADFALPLLPVHSARELAIGLARQWRCWAKAEAAVVAAGFVRSERKLIVRCDKNRLPQVSETAFARRDADLLLAFLASSDQGAAVGVAKPIAVVPFRCSHEIVGGVALYSSTPLELSGDSIAELAAWSGRLCEQAAVVEQGRGGAQALEAAKAAALAEFAAGAGHEINNPLATIAGRVQILLQNETHADRRQNLVTIGAQAARVRDMIADLMLVARPPAPAPRRLLINEVAASVVERFEAAAQSRSCSLSLDAAAPVFATADVTQVQVVLSELIRNGLDAIDRLHAQSSDMRGTQTQGRPPAIILGLARATSNGQTGAMISVTDNGVGLSGRDRAHLFDPFYSGRDAGRGLGFGLTKCRRIVSQHGGWIDFESVPPVATTFRVFWPDAPGPAAHDATDMATQTVERAN